MPLALYKAISIDIFSILLILLLSEPGLVLKDLTISINSRLLKSKFNDKSKTSSLVQYIHKNTKKIVMIGIMTAEEAATPKCISRIIAVDPKEKGSSAINAILFFDITVESCEFLMVWMRMYGVTVEHPIASISNKIYKFAGTRMSAYPFST